MALTASPTDQAALLELQSSDNRLQQLENQVKRLPEIEQLEVLHREQLSLRQRLLAETGAVEDSRIELARIESDVEVVAARIARDSDRLQVSTSTKDVAGLEHELASLSKRRDDLEEIQLGVMERLEGLESTMEATRSELDRSLAVTAETETARGEALSVIEAELVHARAHRQSIADGLPSDLLDLYERQRARYGMGASHLKGGVSSASGVRLNESDMAGIRSAAPDAVLLCPESQAILVRTETSGL